MSHDDKLREKLVTYLQDACAMERQLVQVLEGQVKDTADYPQIQARIQQHLDETRMHEQRMEERLSAHHERPSSMKSLGSSLLGNLSGALSGGRNDDLSKAARDDYAAEHMEIAAYELLIATAQLCGDNETIMAAQANLRDEVRMANWLEQHLPETVVYSFQRDGVSLDDSQIPTLRQTALNALQQAQAGLAGAGMAAAAGGGATSAMSGQRDMGGQRAMRDDLRDDRGDDLRGGARGATRRAARDDTDRGMRGDMSGRGMSDQDMAHQDMSARSPRNARRSAQRAPDDRDPRDRDMTDQGQDDRDMAYDRDLTDEDQGTTPPNAL